MADTFITCDIGRLQDYTAITVVQVKFYDKKLVTGGVPQLSFDPRDVIPVFEVPFIERFQAPYRATLMRLKEIWEFPQLYACDREIVVDATGVGDAVIEMAYEMDLDCTPVVITGGDAAHYTDDRYFVPRKELVDALVVAYQARRLRISPDLDRRLTDQLETEMNNLQIRRSPTTAKETYEAISEMKHDDLALSLAMGIWRGMQDHHREIAYQETWDARPAYNDDDLTTWGIG